MYIKRDMDTYLERWKQTNEQHLILLVQGARQVGKTETIKHFGETQYRNCVYIEINQNHTDLFSELYTQVTHGMITLLQAVEKYAAVFQVGFSNDHHTLLIIDEIQYGDGIFAELKKFRASLSCDIIVTGSYLGQVKQGFIPIGAFQTVTMYPVSFLEYLQFVGRPNLIRTLKYTEEEREWLYQQYTRYCTVGGYPQAIITDLSGGNVYDYFEELIEHLRQEYAPKMDLVDLRKISVMLQSVISIISREKKGYKRIVEDISKITAQHSFIRLSTAEVNRCLGWLLEAHLINEVGKYDFSKGVREPGERFYVTDVGLCNYYCIRSGLNRATTAGLVAEAFVNACFVYNELNKSMVDRMICFGIDANYELDFYMQRQVILDRIGVEVKAGSNSGKSLQHLLNNGSLDKAVYFRGSGGFGCNGNLITMPIFCAAIFNVDLIGEVQQLYGAQSNCRDVEVF